MSMCHALDRRPDVTDTETEALLAYLNPQREHVLSALEGLSDEDLRRPTLPSGWTPLGLVRHLALDVERFWFQRCVAGEPTAQPAEGSAWQVPAGVPAAEILDLYRSEIETANGIIATTPPDALPRWWPDEIFPDYPIRPLRNVILHVLAETATHAGHLDAARELIDGTQWLVLDG
jgi:hypothetical protein